MEFTVEKRLINNGNSTEIKVSCKDGTLVEVVDSNLLTLESEHLGYLIVDKLKRKLMNGEK